MSASTIVSTVTSLLSTLTAAAGASPWGFGAIGLIALLLGIGGWIGWNKVIGNLNAKTDARDQANAGSDAGETAVDLTNQGEGIEPGLDAQQASHPPTAPDQTK